LVQSRKPTRTASGEAKARRAVIDTARAMSRSGLTPGRSGNVSCRWKEGMLVTPSGLPYEELIPDDIVLVRGDGSWPARQRKPSSEWHFHLSIYRARPDAGAVVHTHSLNATVLACAHKPIPAFHYMVAVAGGADIPLVPYATFGTEELARLVAVGVAKRNACLLANHGQIALGATLPQALELAQEVETLSAQYLRVLELGAEHILDGAEMARVLEKFKGYGQKGQG
jgi:L-fuculose-phosphate aldolase